MAKTSSMVSKVIIGLVGMILSASYDIHTLFGRLLSCRSERDLLAFDPGFQFIF